MLRSHWILLGLLLSLFVGLPGCEEEVAVEEPVEENEVVGTWLYRRKERTDTLDMKLAFHSRGKFEQQIGHEWLVGLWHLEDKDVVVRHVWMKQPNGEELDVQTSGLSTRYHVKMRGKDTLLVEKADGTAMEFFKNKKHTGLFNKDVGLTTAAAAGDPVDKKEKKDDKKDEKKSGH